MSVSVSLDTFGIIRSLLPFYFIVDMHVQTLKMQTAANIGYLEYTSIIFYGDSWVYGKDGTHENIYILSIESALAQ